MDKHVIFQLVSAAVVIIFLLMMKTLAGQQPLSHASTVYHSSNILGCPDAR